MKKTLSGLVLTAVFLAATPASQANPSSLLSSSDLHFSATNANATASVIEHRYKAVELNDVADEAAMTELYPYALMSYFADMHKVDSSKANKKAALEKRVELLSDDGFSPLTDQSELPAFWQKYFEEQTQQRLVVPSVSLKMRFYRHHSKKQLVVAIAGTDFSPSAFITSVTSAYNLANGTASDAALTALFVVRDLQEKYDGYNIELTGASQGGAIAQYVVSNTKNTSAIVFNSEFLHPSLSSELDGDRVKHSYVEGESLNGESYHFARALVKNTAPVKSTVLPVSEELSSIITNKYYQFSTSGSPKLGWLSYQTTTASFVRHWTGAILETIEYHTQDNLPSIF
ncbi:hypothetical protein EOPP23_09955 [Endozoicomonas sp. OPT23]|uniref:hypothetical protein n=1 Tax=Endozoicomonas sp. OPT23 TaxID=2072845 RepID=UPI00129AF363|nr:hypothetical protein [Endozoicomonas sp. OPT23]MRI33306.1 hypothetical protein [Endozoicomonas sp. OPT23]